jgi:MFS family permease
MPRYATAGMRPEQAAIARKKLWEEFVEEKVSGASWFAAITLFLAHVLSYADRTVVSLLVEPIKADFHLTDVQISLLLGISFVLLYSVLGVPIAMLADRGSRKRIILAGMALWTVATAACGMARSFMPLFAARTAVGIGEACLQPSAYSLLSDMFPRRLLPTAIATYTCGVYVGAAAALLIGGVITGMAMEVGTVHVPLLGEFKAWQVTFLVMGVMGLPFLILVALIKEPKRRSPHMEAEAVSMAALGRHATQTKVFLAVYVVGLLLVAIGGIAIQSWAPTVLIRVHGWSIREAGIAIGLIFAIGGVSGALTAAWAAAVLQRRGMRDAVIRIMAVAAGTQAGSSLLIMHDNGWVSPTGIGLNITLSAVQGGVGVSSLMLTTPPRLRAKISSIFSLLVSFIGIGAGPIIVAFMTQQVYGDPNDLGKAVGLLAFLCLAGACLLYALGRHAFLRALLRQEEAGSTSAVAHAA